MSRRFRLDNVWRTALRDLGLDREEVLRRAGLPLDLLNQPDPMVDTGEYFRLVEAVDSAVGDPDLGLHIGQTFTVDVFDPSLFAAACSPNLELAAQRVATYKSLMGPFRLGVEWTSEGLELQFRCTGQPELPALLGMVDLTFSVQWLRHVTRARVVPVHVGVLGLPADPAPYEAFFGVSPQLDDEYSLVISEIDAKRPFLTANPGLWSAFEPELRRRLAEQSSAASVQERLEAALLELLPSGRSQRPDAARVLGLSERTLQRRLKHEGTSFQQVLARTREALARHYLCRTEMTPVEIAYLLGFADPNSLFRAFYRWTGTTPDAVRRAARRAD